MADAGHMHVPCIESVRSWCCVLRHADENRMPPEPTQFSGIDFDATASAQMTVVR